MLKKKIICLSICVASLSGAFARESGAFVGLGGLFGFESNLKASLREEQNGNNDINDTGKSLAAGGELIAGYNFFFTQRFGIRGYVSGAYSVMFFDKKSIKLGTSNYVYGSNLNKLTGLVDVNLNLDLMLDIVSSSSFDFGIYAGVGGGFHFWHGGLMDEVNAIKTQVSSSAPPANHNYDVKAQSFFASLTLNAGLTTTINSRHSLEISAKIPFLEDPLLRYKTKSQPNQQGPNDRQNYLKISMPYSVGLRYILNF